jgi:hypothetical protein
MSDAAAFSAVVNLIALVSDAKACAKRLEELRATITAAETAAAQLEAARVANLRADAERKADLDRRQARLVEAEVELRLRREAFDQREARRNAVNTSGPPEPADEFPYSPNFEPGTRSHTGLARARHNG